MWIFEPSSALWDMRARRGDRVQGSSPSCVAEAKAGQASKVLQASRPQPVRTQVRVAQLSKAFKPVRGCCSRARPLRLQWDALSSCTGAPLLSLAFRI